MRLFEQTFIDFVGDSKAESPLRLQTWSLNGIRSDRLLPTPRMRGALSMIGCVFQQIDSNVSVPSAIILVCLERTLGKVWIES